MSQQAPLLNALLAVYHYECQSQFYGILEKIRSFELSAKADKPEI